jgi:eukaryotic-like serine/threonine-protein kinase
MGQSTLQSGQTVAGKYRLNQPIGAGGMASVWSATNVFTERHFAIKFMHPAVAKTPEAARRFLMEAKVSARVNHPNIIEIIDVGQTEDGSLFMVMELLQGVSLETAMRRQSTPMLLSEFISVMIDVARALAAAHKNGVVHRDLKPTNVYLHMIREGVAVPKLLDFGVSKFVEEQNHALTVAGTVLGSPLYMSPEQAMGAEGIDGRTDIFAFGAILFEAVCGFRAYDAPNFNALIVTIATKQPKSVDEGAPGMPESLRALIRECLTTERKNRIGSFDEIIDRLIAILPIVEQSGLRLPPPRVIGPPSDPDATNALPVVRVSDHPGAGQVAGVHISIPAPSKMPKISVDADRGATTVIRPPPVALFVALGVGIASVAFAIIFVVSRGIGEAHGTTATTAPTATTPSTPPVSTNSIELGSDPPTVNVDSLPVSSARAANPVKGMGLIAVASSPRPCAVAIDGTARGWTPLAAVTLATGPHELQCFPVSGKGHTATVTVAEGMMSKFRFDLGDGP